MNEREQAQYKKMIETPIPKLITGMAAPTIISMLVTAIYNTADTYFVALLGTQAAAAVGIVFSLMSLIQTIGFTIGIGSGSQISKMLGEKRKDDADRIYNSGLLFGLVLGFIMMILGLIFNRPLMMLLGATDSSVDMAMEYAKYILIFCPLVVGSYVMNNDLRSEGKAKFSMIGIFTGCILNIGLDPLFIFAFDMGIAGAALATGLSQTVSFCILISHYLRKKTVIDIKLSSFGKSAKDYLDILRFGSPSFFRQGLGTVAIVIMNNVAGAFGDGPLAAVSIVSKLTFILGAVVVGFGQGFQPVAGYNYGAKRYDRVKGAIKFSLAITVALMVVLGLGSAALAKYVIMAFSEDAEVIAIGTICLRSQCLVFPLVPFVILCNMTFQAIGRPLIASITSSLRQGICFIPLIIILPHFWGALGVAFAQAVSDFLSVLISIPFYIVLFKELNNKQEIIASESSAYGNVAEK